MVWGVVKVVVTVVVLEIPFDQKMVAVSVMIVVGIVIKAMIRPTFWTMAMTIADVVMVIVVRFPEKCRYFPVSVVFWAL